MYEICFHKSVLGQMEKLKAANLSRQAKALIDILREDPFQTPPPYEKLVGNLNGKYSRRISLKHRLVYAVDEEKRLIHVLSMWSYFDFSCMDPDALMETRYLSANPEYKQTLIDGRETPLEDCVPERGLAD